MNSKIIIPITIIISIALTAGIMYSIDFEQTTQVSPTVTPEIIYVDKVTTTFFEGTNNIKKISSQEELKGILDASSMFRGFMTTEYLQQI